MSRKLFAFLLSELNLVRVKCGKCKNVVEIKAEDLGANFGNNALCPICGVRFSCSSGPQSPFTLLATAIKDFRNTKDVEIEFVLPDETGK